MADSASAPPESGAPGRGRGRGRGKSRGGLGKYLRARGRGRGRGRPAEFQKRLVLEGEEEVELNEEEQQETAREMAQKYGRRQLGTNVDRYAEPEPELDSDGEAIVEPEVDLSALLERQKLSDSAPTVEPRPEEDEDDIDENAARILGIGKPASGTKKGRVQQIEWDAELEEMSQEKAAAEAARDLKARFKAQTARQRARPPTRGAVLSGRAKPERGLAEAPPLPSDHPEPKKSEKEEMQDFLDDLIG
ncbi:uncharacterized protein BXZ73DRAFT_92492 [Epithele typhae]|uniref:uncharacterized protein n=1 Tax=Epithele typhae TaxID=378194 RepID=UPI0020086562|nr:uncharacterized protein BXZ73DRAFT_92492 [Epithele typhae]KAH9916387.1 hypothetical protein BXZ73DRAFT_92492 [Epithele typhae]